MGFLFSGVPCCFSWWYICAAWWSLGHTAGFFILKCLYIKLYLTYVFLNIFLTFWGIRSWVSWSQCRCSFTSRSFVMTCDVWWCVFLHCFCSSSWVHVAETVLIYKSSRCFQMFCGAFSGPTFESVFCRPIARPSKTEWSEREMKSMKERKGEWAWKSTWTWWPLLSRSLLAPCPCPCPCPFLFSCNRGALSSWTPPPPWQVRTIFSSMRTVKKPAAMMNSGRGKLVCFRPRHKRNTFYVQFSRVKNYRSIKIKRSQLTLTEHVQTLTNLHFPSGQFCTDVRQVIWNDVQQTCCQENSTSKAADET